MSNSWPAVLPETVPAKPINDYSGELSAANVRMLSNLTKKMHYNSHVVILPRATDIGSADSLATDAFNKWQLGAKDILLIVDLDHSTVGSSMGASLANKGISTEYVRQMVPALGGKNGFSRGTTYGTIARVMRAVDRSERAALQTADAGENPATVPVSYSGANAFSSLGVFMLVSFVAVIMIFRVRITAGTRRMTLNKSGKLQIGDSDDAADLNVQVPLREFAKRVHVKNPDEDYDTAATSAQGLADEVMRKGRINTAEFLKKHSDQIKTGQVSGDNDSALEAKFGPPQTEGHATFAQLGTVIAESESTFANVEPAAPESDQARQFDVAEQAETKPTKPELERRFQSDLGNYGDQMVKGDRDQSADNSSAAAPNLASTTASVTAAAAAPIPSSFLEMAREHTSALPPPSPQNPALPGALSMPESPIDQAELDSPLLKMPASPAYNLNSSGGFPDYSTTTGTSGAEEALPGAPQKAVLCPKCGAEKSSDFAFCLKCGQMFV
jgi:uncharacterized membrane protein YgcG